MTIANKSLKRRGKPGESGYTFVYVFLALGAILSLFPFIWMILTSFKTQTEAIRIPPAILPENWSLDAYRQVFDVMPFSQIYSNTVIQAVVTTLGQVLFYSMAGYAFARIDFPLKNVLFLLVMAILMVPGTIFIIPQYLIIQNLGLLNTVTAIFLPNLFSAFGTFLLRQFYMGLPLELEEAARLDGCSHFRIFVQIMAPLTVSGMFALGILTFRFAWNNLMWPSIVNSSMSKMTLSAALSNMQGQYATDFPALMAGAVMAIIPMIIVFVAFQKQFIEGIALTGTKG